MSADKESALISQLRAELGEWRKLAQLMALTDCVEDECVCMPLVRHALADTTNWARDGWPTQWRDPVEDPPEEGQVVLFHTLSSRYYGAYQKEYYGETAWFANTEKQNYLPGKFVKGWQPYPELP